jgi:RNA polymerase sigma-70 factor (ECF subfamily)
VNQLRSEAAELPSASAAVDLETLFVAEYANVARLIARIVRDPGRAEELAVEVFLRHAGHRTLEVRMLYRDAVRLGLDEIRRQSRRASLLRLFPGSGRAPMTPEQHQIGQDRKGQVSLVLGRLKKRDAELLLLRAEGLSYEELAAALSIKPSSVGSLLSRAQDAFRKEYTKRYGEAR